MSTSWPIDPDATLDWTWDWSTWLATSETITGATVTAGTLVGTVDTTTHDDTTVTAWVHGVTDGGTITCHVITSAGREDDRSIVLYLTNR